nr:immunoglobulin heavy chain junction region [Macaca mulatta]MOY21301.1 immunoglobulin heavy chain junction region [Macaca mulatta]MOY21353.1 immunoglobulin heavy chain junction region [Macaca mulatta]MOY21402.1 immunoglobulin heavy chain junction region [Macaca mulatta]MOY21478.1 immunoglobulin heavy chain junction region [Macaca mulatta]
CARHPNYAYYWYFDFW